MADTNAPGWVHEHSFGEYRSVLLDGDEVLAARLNWFSHICVGTIATAKVLKRSKGAKNALCVTRLPRAGYEVDVSDLPLDASEGSEVRIMIHREPMAERGRYKRAKGRYFGDHPDTEAFAPMNDLIRGEEVRRLPAGVWEEIWSLAADGELAFAGGNLVITPTPAMTLIDIDGNGSARDLSLLAVPAIAKALRYMDLGGNIGIDFPTIAAKADRKAVDAALDAALSDWPHERTAMNGFGFVQIIARLQLPSLLHRLEYARSSSCARYLMRQAERLEGTGRCLLLTCHPEVETAIQESWTIELREKSGKEVRIETDAALALEAGFAQLVEL